MAAALAMAALLAVSGSLQGSPRWTPDGLFYQARSLELRGVDRDTALDRAFEGNFGAELRRRDPLHAGDPAWVRYNAPFYERRVAIPLAAAALEPVAGERTILDLSIAGYVAAVLAIFGLLLLRFRLPIAAGVTLLTVFLPALTDHSSYPAHRQLGARARDRGVRLRHPRDAPRAALADPLDGLDPRPLTDARQHLDPDCRSGVANVHVEV